ncbi:MAG: ABC transporter substrate-binding protein [candidate division SR1 bacterium]|nr:ABC transporter substrate-binding protein [candidate division SR1 bacterium]
MKKRLSLTLILGVLLATLAGCTQTSTSTEIKAIKIGVIAPVSGPATDYGMDGVNTYRYLTDKFNAEHKNLKIDLIVEDGKCNGKDATSAAQKLINIDQVPVIMGGSCSAETMPAGKLAQENGVVLMDSVSSDPIISTLGDHVFKYINDTYAGKKLSEQVSKRFKSIILVYDNNDYGVALSDAVRKNYQGKILADIKVQIDEKDLSLVAKQIKSSNAEGVVVIDQDDTHAIAKAKAFQKEGLLSLYKGKIMSAYFYSATSFLDGVGDIMEGAQQVDVPLVDNLGNKAQSFVAEFEKSYPIKVVASYIVFQGEAMKVILDAIVAGNYDSISIQKYLHAIDQNNQREGFLGSITSMEAMS